MLKSKELNDPKICLNKAREDEPIFVLLERDPSAAAAVKAWIKDRIRIGRNRADDPKIMEAVAWVEAAERAAPEHRLRWLEGLSKLDAQAIWSVGVELVEAGWRVHFDSHGGPVNVLNRSRRDAIEEALAEHEDALSYGEPE